MEIGDRDGALPLHPLSSFHGRLVLCPTPHSQVGGS